MANKNDPERKKTHPVTAVIDFFQFTKEDGLDDKTARKKAAENYKLKTGKELNMEDFEWLKTETEKLEKVAINEQNEVQKVEGVYSSMFPLPKGKKIKNLSKEWWNQ